MSIPSQQKSLLLKSKLGQFAVDAIPVSPGIPLPSELVAELQRVTERGLLSIDTVVGEGDGAGGANGLWEGHHWTTVKEYLEGGAKSGKVVDESCQQVRHRA